MLLDDLGLDPSPELTNLERAILEHALPPVARPRQADDKAPSLPAVEPLIGRDALLDEVAGLLGTVRLVTLHGLGGIGKTSLALAVGERLARAGQPVRFADLTAVTTADNALEELCRALGVDGSADPMGALGHAAPALLIVDNAEQVVDLPARVAEVLRRNGDLRFLVTSRVPLQVRGEHAVAVPPLPIHADTTSEPDAVRMFEVCARRARAGVDLSDKAAIAALCELTGGLPLAIELVARRVRSSPPARLAEQLRAQADRLVDLEGGPDVPARQRSIRTVIGWSVERLSPAARALLVALGPVNGPLSWSMIDELADDPGWVDGLDELVAGGLVSGPDAHDLYRLPVPVIEVVRSIHTDDAHRAEDPVVQVIRSLVTGARRPEKLVADAAAVDAAMRLAIGHHDAPAAIDLLVGLLSYWVVADRLGEGMRFADDVRALEPAAQLDGAADALLGDVDLPADALRTTPTRAAITPIRQHEGYATAAAIGAADPYRTAARWLASTPTS